MDHIPCSPLALPDLHFLTELMFSCRNSCGGYTLKEGIHAGKFQFQEELPVKRRREEDERRFIVKMKIPEEKMRGRNRRYKKDKSRT